MARRVQADPLRWAQVNGWRVSIALDTGHTWYENQVTGAGGLLEIEHNNGNSVVEGYDGAFELPAGVVRACRLLNFTFGEHVLPEGMEA